MDLKQWIRDVPDYPKPGILFRDLTPVLAHPPAFARVVELLTERFRTRPIDAIGAIDARGFLFGAPVALNLGLPLIPVRKAGKLPPETVSEEFELEYGTARIEIRTNAVARGARVVIVDDLLATGGTARAAANVFRQLGAHVEAFAFVVELTDLDGRAALEGVEVTSLVQY